MGDVHGNGSSRQKDEAIQPLSGTAANSFLFILFYFFLFFFSSALRTVVSDFLSLAVLYLFLLLSVCISCSLQ